MRTTKPLLTLAIMLALPLTAIAADFSDYTFSPVAAPVRVQKNGTIVRSQYSGPYMTATINSDDGEHIASTAYVKGAYNDMIAATNSLEIVKQDALYNGILDDYMSEDVWDSDEFLNIYTNTTGYEETEDSKELHLISAKAVMVGLDSVKNNMNNKRVEIYTTWDDDTAKQQVAFVTAQ